MATRGTRNGQTTSTRLGGLDGVRALAVLAVLTFHEQLSAIPGGFLGVDVFFVLSGYLITDLLVAQWDRAGHLDMRDFWVRRARRLLPALAVMLVVVTAAAAIIEPAQLDTLRQALAAAVTYSSNWWQALQPRSYFAQFGPPPPLQHLWSLAIEEQFYLVWPLILVVVLLTCQSRRIRAGIAWLGAALSALVMFLVYVPGADPSRVYYGTDTHASALLIGCALALAWPLRRLRLLPREKAQVADAFGVAGIAVLGWAIGHFSGDDSALYPGGLLLAALAAAGIVIAAASPGLVSWLLSWAPLRWIGLRSYAIYLWHWPVIALTAAVLGNQPTSGWVWGLETAVAIGLAAASWRWIEEPILRNGFRATLRSCYRVVAGLPAAARRSPVAALPAIGLLAAVTVTGTAGYGVLNPPGASGLARQISHGIEISQASQTQPAVPPTAAAGQAPDTHAPHPGSRHSGASGQRGSVRQAPGQRTAGQLPASPPSTAAPGAGPPAAPSAAAAHGSEVTAIGDSVMLACASQLTAALPGIYINAQVSRQVEAGLSLVAQLAARGQLRRVVVFALGTNGMFSRSQVRDLMALIGPQRTLVLVNTYVPKPWQDPDNQVIATAAGAHPHVVLANWHAAISGRTSLLYPDEVHPQPPGARLYTGVVVSAIQDATARLSSAG